MDIRTGPSADSSNASCRTADYFAYDDLPVADEHVIRAHAAELIAMAEGIGLTNVRDASGNPLVVTRTERVEPQGENVFAERASFLLGQQVRVYSDGVLSNPGVSPDLVTATPR